MKNALIVHHLKTEQGPHYRKEHADFTDDDSAARGCR